MPPRRHIAICAFLCLSVFNLVFLIRSRSTPDCIIYRHGYVPTELFESVHHTVAIASNSRIWTVMWIYNDPHHQEEDLGWTTGVSELLWLQLGGSTGDDQLLEESGAVFGSVGYTYQKGTFTSEDTVQESCRRIAVHMPQDYLAILCLIGAALLGHRLVHRLLSRRHRRPHNHSRCRKCHYDLRAHRPGDRCPECGTAIPHNRV